MKFSVDQAIFAKFPGVKVGLVVIKNLNNQGHNAEILTLLRAEEQKQKEGLNGVELGSLPEIAAWRQIYTAFGSNHDYRSSAESLLRRARGGQKPLPQINNLVDLYNYLSLKYHLPAGAEDLDKIVGDIALTFASGQEKGLSLGAEAEETCYSGEVIYKDAQSFICRRWNWREADRTKIEETTKRTVLVLEKVPQLADSVLGEALEEAQKLITDFLGGECAIMVIDSDHQTFSLE